MSHIEVVINPRACIYIGLSALFLGIAIGLSLGYHLGFITGLQFKSDLDKK
jgi:hypothetical protein